MQEEELQRLRQEFQAGGGEKQADKNRKEAAHRYLSPIRASITSSMALSSKKG